MGDKSAIQWTDATWNPVTGCSKVSPGCAHCYAETVTAKYAGRNPGFIAEHRPWTPANAEHNVTLWPNRLEVPLRWRKPRMVFVNSMSDLFHEQVPDEYIAQVFSVMRRAPQHTFQVLTKRPERMRDFMRRLAWCSASEPYLYESGGDAHAEPFGPPFICPNVWLGVSIENRRFVDRADVLRETPAAVRFVSAEPLLGPLTWDHAVPVINQLGYHELHPITRRPAYASCWRDGYEGSELILTDIDWLIVGGESGPGHRPIQEHWVTDLRDMAAHYGTAFFFKQWGGRTPKSGGRELDGRTWDEMPCPRLLSGASNSPQADGSSEGGNV